MNKEQVKLWYYLKDNESQMYNDVRSGLSKDIVNAYDIQYRVVASSDDIIAIDRSIQVFESKAGPVDQKKMEINSDMVHDQQLPLSIVDEPDSILAYYLMVFPLKLAKKLDGMLPLNKKQRVLHHLDKLKPHRLPKNKIGVLLSFILNQSEPKTSESVGDQKVRIMEQLVGEEGELSGPFVSYCLNPKVDLFLFSNTDQVIILSELIAKKRLIPLLTFLNQAEQQLYVSNLSKRQQAILLDLLKNEKKLNYDYANSRNSVIEIIRQLQDDDRIDASIKRFSHD